MKKAKMINQLKDEIVKGTLLNDEKIINDIATTAITLYKIDIIDIKGMQLLVDCAKAARDILKP